MPWMYCPVEWVGSGESKSIRLSQPSIDVLAELVERGGSGLTPPLVIPLADPEVRCAVGPGVTPPLATLLVGVGQPVGDEVEGLAPWILVGLGPEVCGIHIKAWNHQCNALWFLHVYTCVPVVPFSVSVFVSCVVGFLSVVGGSLHYNLSMNYRFSY